MHICLLLNIYFSFSSSLYLKQVRWCLLLWSLMMQFRKCSLLATNTSTIGGWPVKKEAYVPVAVVTGELYNDVVTGQHHGTGMLWSTIFSFRWWKNRNRLFILVCFFWLNVKELESLTFLRKNRFFLSKLYLWDCFGFRHRLWLGHTCNFHCPLVRICPQTPILCAKVNEFRFYLCTSILCF